MHFFLGRETLHIFLVLSKVTYFAYVHIPTIIYTLLGGILAFLGISMPRLWADEEGLRAPAGGISWEMGPKEDGLAELLSYNSEFLEILYINEPKWTYSSLCNATTRSCNIVFPSR